MDILITILDLLTSDDPDVIQQGTDTGKGN